MESVNLNALADELLAVAAGNETSGRAARTLHGGRSHPLRQTVLALASGHMLKDHVAPGEATLQVLEGRVRVATADDSWDGVAGDYLVIPAQRHNLVAFDHSVVLLTVLVQLD